jgi:hypothetical protein
MIPLMEFDFTQLTPWLSLPVPIVPPAIFDVDIGNRVENYGGGAQNKSLRGFTTGNIVVANTGATNTITQPTFQIDPPSSQKGMTPVRKAPIIGAALARNAWNTSNIVNIPASSISAAQKSVLPASAAIRNNLTTQTQVPSPTQSSVPPAYVANPDLPPIITVQVNGGNIPAPTPSGQPAQPVHSLANMTNRNVIRIGRINVIDYSPKRRSGGY